MKQPYVCIRCGYETHHKPAMNKHLYTKKKPCPMIENEIELTLDIKEHILNNRIYKITQPATVQQVINNNINNYNTINNFVANLDTIEKLTKYTEYKKIDVIDFNQSVEDKYAGKVKRLESNPNKYGFELQIHDFLDIINEISKVSNEGTFEFSMLYDSKINRLKFYEDGVWEEILLAKGLKQIITVIQDALFDSYEFYLIRKMNNDACFRTRQEMKELLEEYYKFIGCFDVNPKSKDKSDGYILQDQDNEDFEVSEKCWQTYNRVRDNLKKVEINSLKKEVLDIIKRNSSKNIDEMNKKIVELFQMDENFKNIIYKL